MTMDWPMTIGLTALAATAVAAIGVNVLHEFSLRELELYCRRRGKRHIYTEVLDRHDRAVVSAECLQVIGIVVVLIAATYRYLEGATRLTSWSPPVDLIVAALAAGFILLVATTWIPLAVVRLWAAPFLFHTWWLWRIINWICAPVSWSLDLVDAIVWRLSGRSEEDEDEEEAFEDEIRAMVNEGLRDGLLEEDAREMIEGVIELGDVTVGQIMTPRSELDALEVETDWPGTLTFVAGAGRTRIPVYRETLDQIVGILYVKDLLAELATRGEGERRPLADLVRPAWRVPQGMQADALLKDFLKNRNHMAIVIDDYHAIAGVVTIEDALEEIVGDIVDEFDMDEEDEYHAVDENTCQATGRARLDDLNSEFGWQLPESEDFDTISGLIISRLGYIPSVGESLEFDDVRVTVLQATPRRIERVQIEHLDQRPTESA